MFPFGECSPGDPVGAEQVLSRREGLVSRGPCERSFTNRTYLAAIEGAARNPPIRTVIRLAIAFLVSFTALFEPIPTDAEQTKRSRGGTRKRPRR
jgi:transcriptional regulator with XRE-family HTH domain